MRKLQNNNAGEPDEHDDQTEILSNVTILPFMPSAESDDTIRIPRRPAQQYVQQQDVYPYLPPKPIMPKALRQDAYPYLPLKPVMPKEEDEQSAHRTTSVQPTKTGKLARSTGVRHSPIPGIVGMLFVVIQLFLLARFALKIIGIAADEFWIGNIYKLSNIFIWPFRVLLQPITLLIPIPISVEVYTLLAILLYGFFSRILVRFLKALLNSR